MTAPPNRAQAPASPLCVVHGPFGTGKSALLVALLHFFAAAGGARCLVAANTNVAVDRVLVGLLDSGFTGTPRPPPRATVPGRCENGRAQALRQLQQCTAFTPARRGVASSQSMGTWCATSWLHAHWPSKLGMYASDPAWLPCQEHTHSPGCGADPAPGLQTSCASERCAASTAGCYNALGALPPKPQGPWESAPAQYLRRTCCRPRSMPHCCAAVVCSCGHSPYARALARCCRHTSTTC